MEVEVSGILFQTNCLQEEVSAASRDGGQYHCPADAVSHLRKLRRPDVAFTTTTGEGVELTIAAWNDDGKRKDLQLVHIRTRKGILGTNKLKVLRKPR